MTTRKRSAHQTNVSNWPQAPQVYNGLRETGSLFKSQDPGLKSQVSGLKTQVFIRETRNLEPET